MQVNGWRQAASPEDSADWDVVHARLVRREAGVRCGGPLLCWEWSAVGVRLRMPVVAMHAGWVPEHAARLLGHLVSAFSPW